jgi:hypothetical protein
MVPSGVTASRTQERKAARAVSGMIAMMTCFIAVRRGVDGAGFSTELRAGCGQTPPRLGLARDHALAKILE